MTTDSGRCAKCFQPLEPGARFCGRCGTEISVPGGDLRSRSSAGTGVECPSCKHSNDLNARFCERCGTQLQSSAGAGSWDQPSAGQATAAGPAQQGQSEDPWATGPGYERPLREDESCPRCGNYRRPEDEACSNCGLPFGQQANYAGVPHAVAVQGVPAGFWIRFVAAIVDSITVTVITLPFGIIGAFVGGASATFLDVISIGISFLYGPVLLSLYGTTVGKKIFNIYILDSRGNKKLNFGQALVRELSKIISGLILLIGYIMAAFRQDKRALHDLIAGTFPTVLDRRN